MYEVIAVRKESKLDNTDYPEVEIEKKVVAKTREEAKGKAGVFELFEEEDYDMDKFKIKVFPMIDKIKAVKE